MLGAFSFLSGVLVLGSLGAALAPSGAVASLPVPVRPSALAGSPQVAVPPPTVLQWAGQGPTVWLMTESRGRVTLWQQTFEKPWHRLRWPSSLVPEELTRTSLLDAWVVTQSRQIFHTANGGHSWQAISVPPLLAAHRNWAEVLLATAPNGSLTLLAVGTEAMMQSAKLLWYRPPGRGQWVLVGRTGAYFSRAATPWWPRTPKATLPLMGEPIALHMVTDTLGYQVDYFGGPPFLYTVTDGGHTVRPTHILGLPRGNMVPSASAWNGSGGWIVGGLSPTRALVVRVDGARARLVRAPHPVNESDGAAVFSTNALSATIATMSGHRWALFTTRNGGQRWSTMLLTGVSDAGMSSPHVYQSHGEAWLLLGSSLYEGPSARAHSWHSVRLP